MPIFLRAIKRHKEPYTALEEIPILFVDSGKSLRKKLKCNEYASYLNTKKVFEQGYHLHLKGMTQYMTTKLVESGITFEALRALYKQFGVAGVVGYLSMKSSDPTKIGVTKTIAALAKIICCLRKLPEFIQV